MKKKFLAAAIGAMLIGGSASASVNEPITASAGGVGDALIAPAYFIGGGMTTDLKVVNTDLRNSVVAKVVFHHPLTSAEVLDFFIYLTPGDVWTGSVSCVTVAADGNCAVSQVKSTDGSVQIEGSATFASVASPSVIQSGAGVADERAPLPNQGYVTITESAAIPLYNKSKAFAPGVNKSDVYLAHELLANNTSGQLSLTFVDPGNPLNPNNGLVFAGSISSEEGVIGAGGVAPVSTPNVLTGTVTANAGTLGSTTLPMLAIKNYDNVVPMTIGANTFGNNTFVARGVTGASDLEDALWGNNFVVPYKVASDALTLVTFTFPTKLAFDGVINGQYVFPDRAGDLTRFSVGSVQQANGTWFTKGAGDVAVKAQAFDNEENTISAMFNVSPLATATGAVSEFGWKIVGSDLKVGNFTEGWLNVTFPNAQVSATSQINGGLKSVNGGLKGVPAVVTVMNKQQGNFTWAYAASAPAK